MERVDLFNFSFTKNPNRSNGPPYLQQLYKVFYPFPNTNIFKLASFVKHYFYVNCLLFSNGYKLNCKYYCIHIGFIPYFVGKVNKFSRVKIFPSKYEKLKINLSHTDGREKSNSL